MDLVTSGMEVLGGRGNHSVFFLLDKMSIYFVRKNSIHKTKLRREDFKLKEKQKVLFLGQFTYIFIQPFIVLRNVSYSHSHRIPLSKISWYLFCGNFLKSNKDFFLFLCTGLLHKTLYLTLSWSYIEFLLGF